MIGRKIVTAKLPQCRVEITHVDYVTRRVADLDSIADAIRRARQNVNPSEKAGHRRLNCQAQDERSKTNREYGRVPIRKQNRDYRQDQQETEYELRDASQVVTRDRMNDAFDDINIDRLGNRKQQDERDGRFVQTLDPRN